MNLKNNVISFHVALDEKRKREEDEAYDWAEEDAKTQTKGRSIRLDCKSLLKGLNKKKKERMIIAIFQKDGKVPFMGRYWLYDNGVVTAYNPLIGYEEIEKRYPKLLRSLKDNGVKIMRRRKSGEDNW